MIYKNYSFCFKWLFANILEIVEKYLINTKNDVVKCYLSDFK